MRPIADLLHRATHRVPGVPAHADAQPEQHRRRNRRHRHSPARPPRVLVAWQRRIAALFGQESS